MASDPPAKLSAEPYPVMPLIVKAPACPPMMTLMVSPRAKWPARAGARAVMAWAGPGRRAVDHALARAWGGAAPSPGVGGLERGIGRPAGRDGELAGQSLAAAAEQLGMAGSAAVGCGDTGNAADTGENRRGNGLGRAAARAESAWRRAVLDHHVGAHARLRDQRVEAVGEG